MKLFLKIAGGLIFMLVLGAVTLKLFAPELFNQIKDKVSLFGKEKFSMIEDHELSIIYPEDLTTLDPTSYLTVNRARLLNMYEGLTAIDKNLSPKPSLAISYGIVDDRTWEFTLRKGVIFHDGSAFDMDDVVASFDRARKKESDLSTLLTIISDIKVIAPDTIHILTKNPDPLLPNKIAAVLIFPSNQYQEVIKKPNGTGPYVFIDYERGKLLKLEAYSQYWGSLPSYKYASINVVPRKEDRFAQLTEGRIDILGGAPFDLVKNIESKGVKILTKPSLEISFLFFNLQDSNGNIFHEQSLREAILYALDKDKIVDFIKGFALPANQFASRGVFGYNNEIKSYPNNPKKASALVKSVESIVRLKTRLDLSEGLDAFGDYIKRALYPIGIDVELNFLSPLDFEKKIRDGSSNFYFMGWRSEFGDVSDFFASVIHSRTSDGKYGAYNGTKYKDMNLDAMIEESERILIPEERLKKLQQIMRKIVEDDIIGMPLFESKIIYGLRENIDWEPRMDGYILAREVR